MDGDLDFFEGRLVYSDVLLDEAFDDEEEMTVDVSFLSHTLSLPVHEVTPN